MVKKKKKLPESNFTIQRLQQLLKMMPLNIQAYLMPWQQILEHMDVYSMCI